MTTRHSPNVPVTDTKVQALLYYHWLTFCNNFTLIEANGVWSYLLAGSNGQINAVDPTKFYATSSVFLVGHVNKYIAIQDPLNPKNTVIAKIIGVPNATTLQLESTVNLSINASNVNYRIIDPGTLPGTGNYFVIQNTYTENQPAWQAKINAASTYVSVVFAPIGGWNVTNSSWGLPTCAERFMHNTIAQSFMVSDPEEGWVFLWTEDTNAGVTANRKAMWFGSLSPFHAPRVTGAASDTNFAAIFGDIVDASTNSNNINRDTTNVSNVCVGQTLDTDNVVTPIYWAQKIFAGTGNDISTLALSSGQNPKTGEIDDYDIIAFQKSPKQAYRGRVPGMRLLNNSVANRTTTTADRFTYVLGNGVGIVWNGKVPF